MSSATVTGAPGTPRRAFARLVQSEARLALREPIGLVWGVGAPLLLVVIFGSIPSFDVPAAELGGLTYFDAYAPILMVFVLAMLAFLSRPLPLASYRELGVLRRMSATPVSPSRVLAAQLVVNSAMATLALLLIVGLGTAFFDLRLPSQVPGFVLTILLAGACLFALGLVASAIAKTARAALAIGNALFFPLAFFAGLWLPHQAMPAVLRGVSEATPTGAAVEALNSTLAGEWPAAAPLLILAGYTGLFAFIAVKRFRWE